MAGASRQSMYLMAETASSIKGVLENLQVKLTQIEAEIKSDEKSKMDFERLLTVLETKRSELLARVAANEEWGKTYDTEVGPFADKFKALVGDIGLIYDKAKAGHGKGIKTLVTEFGYHPLWKRPGDTFTGIPYRPV